MSDGATLPIISRGACGGNPQIKEASTPRTSSTNSRDSYLSYKKVEDIVKSSFDLVYMLFCHGISMLGYRYDLLLTQLYRYNPYYGQSILV